jgi:hypothetical protein
MFAKQFGNVLKKDVGIVTKNADLNTLPSVCPKANGISEVLCCLPVITCVNSTVMYR